MVVADVGNSIIAAQGAAIAKVVESLPAVVAFKIVVSDSNIGLLQINGAAVVKSVVAVKAAIFDAHFVGVADAESAAIAKERICGHSLPIPEMAKGENRGIFGGGDALHAYLLPSAKWQRVVAEAGGVGDGKSDRVVGGALRQQPAIDMYVKGTIKKYERSRCYFQRGDFADAQVVRHKNGIHIPHA